MWFFGGFYLESYELMLKNLFFIKGEKRLVILLLIILLLNLFKC